MRRAVAILPAGSFTDAAAAVTLAADERHRRRIRLTDDDGRPFLLDLPNAAQLKDGEGLALEGGGVIRVQAAAEEVLDLICADAARRLRLVWHLGNRHVPLQFLDEVTIRVRADHTLPPLAERMGARVERRRAPFQPEPGAFDPHGLLDAPPPVVRRS